MKIIRINKYINAKILYKKKKPEHGTTYEIVKSKLNFDFIRV